MIEPIEMTREEFPKSLSVSEGMITLKITDKDLQLNYAKDIPYVTRKDGMRYLQIIHPTWTDEKIPLIVFVPGSAFHKIPSCRFIPNKQGRMISTDENERRFSILEREMNFNY